MLVVPTSYSKTVTATFGGLKSFAIKDFHFSGKGTVDLPVRGEPQVCGYLQHPPAEEQSVRGT